MPDTEQDDSRRYDPLQHDWDSLRHSLTLHPPQNGDVAALMDQVRDAALTFGEEILAACPRSRERQIALQRLESCLMWCTKSIACNQDAAVQEGEEPVAMLILDETVETEIDTPGQPPLIIQGSASEMRLSEAPDGS